MLRSFFGIILFTCILRQGRTYRDSTNVTALFLEHKLIHKLVPVPPFELCSVIFNPQIEIIPGKPFFPYQVQGAPRVIWNPKNDTYYTLYCAGLTNLQFIYPDKMAFGRFSDFPRSEWIQWLVNDIPGGNISAGNVLYPFKRFSDPSITTRTGYVFLVFEQDRKMNLTMNNRSLVRHTFPHLAHDFTPVKQFMQNHENLTLLAGNIFYLEEDKTRLTTDKFGDYV